MILKRTIFLNIAISNEKMLNRKTNKKEIQVPFQMDQLNRNSINQKYTL